MSTERPVAPILIALGSNIDPAASLRRAVAELAGQLIVVAVSPVYRSAPIGAPGTPDFYNAAIEIETARAPEALKWDVLRPLEAALGRRRVADRNAPRTIDLDLVLYGDRVTDGGVVLPDPDIVRYPHLARPLADLHPSFVHPTDGRTLAAIATELAAGDDLARVELELAAPPAPS